MVPVQRTASTGALPNGNGRRDFRIVGSSPLIDGLCLTISRVAPSRVSVLITGESGTGKELVARALHSQSGRRGRLVTVNCSAIPRDLVESDLFGHVKGAFTNAIADKKGRFEVANGGTLFLDEVGDMPLETQPKLLRVVEYGECERVGDPERVVQTDVRIVCATNKDLEEEVKRGRFREELLTRINVAEIRVPSLRERLSDVPLLVQHFLDGFNNADRRSVQIDDGAIVRIQQLAPRIRGNVRGLRTLVERAALNAVSEVITPDNPAFSSAENAIARDGSFRAELCSAPVTEESIRAAIRRIGPFKLKIRVSRGQREINSCLKTIALETGIHASRIVSLLDQIHKSLVELIAGERRAKLLDAGSKSLDKTSFALEVGIKFSSVEYYAKDLGLQVRVSDGIVSVTTSES